MQVAQAGARLAPGDPDRTAPKVLKLRPWDRLRFLWRGSVRAVLSGMRFDLSSAIGPDVTKAASRLTVSAHHLVTDQPVVPVACFEAAGIRASIRTITDTPTAQEHFLISMRPAVIYSHEPLLRSLRRAWTSCGRTAT